MLPCVKSHKAWYTAARWLCFCLIPANRFQRHERFQVLVRQTGGAVFDALAGVRLSTTNIEKPQ